MEVELYALTDAFDPSKLISVDLSCVYKKGTRSIAYLLRESVWCYHPRKNTYWKAIDY